MSRKFWRRFSVCSKSLAKERMDWAKAPPALLPPVNRSMQILDRSFFQKSVPLSAARVIEPRLIASVRAALNKSKETLTISRLKPVIDDPDAAGAKLILLRPEIKFEDTSTWSDQLRGLSNAGQITVRPYDFQLTYDVWPMQNILDSILPEMPEDESETPGGFAQAGHVAHLNLRSQYLPYRFLIGQVLLDKNPSVRTVINKTLNVGTKSAFRTFPYEVLVGPDDLNVTVNESGCEFNFNFGKVYWNSRLGSEHERLLLKFQEGEAVCDVMAGVGPFAVPAGKKMVFVHANDLNPESFVGLKNAIERNKVLDFVKPSCEDGRAFIRRATQEIALIPRKVHWTPNLRLSRHLGRAELEKRRKEATRTYLEPTSFDHYVMNLPDSAVEFLDAFRGVYEGRESDFAPSTIRRLPMVHVYLFQARHATDEEEQKEICERISEHLGAPIRLSDPSCELELYYSRLVAPNKKYYCASFRLPAAVAFASR